VIAFLLIVYTGLVLVLFKLKIVKPRPYPLAFTLLVGVLIIGGVVVAWMQFAPLSPKVVTTQYVIPLVPYVKGQVRRVVAKANQTIKKGDLLLEIEPAPYQFAVEQAEAQLAAAKANVNQAQAAREGADANVAKAGAGITQAQAALAQAKATLINAQASFVKAKAGLANAQAGVNKAKAGDDLAKTEESIALGLQRTDAGAISALKVTQAVQNREVANAALTQARSAVDEAQAGVTQADAAVNQAQAGVLQAQAVVAQAESAKQQAEAADRQARAAVQVAQNNVPAIQAQLREAQFNLAQCKMYAPADGYVVDWQVQDGTMLVPVPLAAAGTFINTSDTSIVAAFPQNYLTNVAPGNEVEVVLDPFPGQLFKGKVDTVISATGAGQFTTGGNIPDAAKIGSEGVLAVKIRLTGDATQPNLPLGAGGTVAIYTEHGKPVHIISKVAIRMQKWLLYVKPSVKKP